MFKALMNIFGKKQSEVVAEVAPAAQPQPTPAVKKTPAKVSPKSKPAVKKKTKK